MSRDFSRIKTSIWHSQKFRKLSEKHRLFYLYLLTCPQANSAGLFKHHIGYMMVDMDWSEDECKKALLEVEKVGLINYQNSENTLFLCGWFAVNPPQNPKHAIKIISDTVSVPYGKLKKIAFQELQGFLEDKDWTLNEKCRQEIDRVLIGYPELDTQYNNNNNNNIREQKRSDSQNDLFGENGKPDPDPEIFAASTENIPEFDPIQEAFKLYNSAAEKIGIPQARSLSETRRKKLKARIKGDNDLKIWKQAMANLGSSPFLRGKNDKGWKADFDFCLQEESFNKLVEGSYSKTSSGQSIDLSKPFEQMSKTERLEAGYRYDSETFTWTDQHGEVMEEPAL